MSLQLDDVSFGLLGPRMRRLLRDNTNDEHTTLICHGANRYEQNLTEGDWEQLGREVASNEYLREFTIRMGALDSEKMTSLFRGLTGSSSIDNFKFYDRSNETGIYDVRSMIPFVQNASRLKALRIGVQMTTDGFAALFRALSNSALEDLDLRLCGLTSLDIDGNCMPEHLSYLDLSSNNIGPDGCRGLAMLLQKENSKLHSLNLRNNNLNDEAIQILVNGLRSNTSLTYINLEGNMGVTKEGMMLLLKLLNDVSSIKATLQSNHTLIEIDCPYNDEYSEIESEISCALQCNNLDGLDGDAAVGKFKVIWTQLESNIRRRMCLSQGIESQFHSIAVPLNEIGPLLLPEVLTIIYEHHGRFNLYEALTLTVADLWATISRKQVLIDKAKVLSDQIGCLTMKKVEVLKEIAAIEQKEAEESNVCEVGVHRNKRQKIS